MNLLTIIGSLIGIAGFVGGLAAWYRRSEGEATIELLKTNIASYQITEAQLKSQLETSEALVKSRDDTIVELRSTLKNMVKEFKEYKNGGN